MMLWLLACTQPEPPLKTSLDLYAQGLEMLEAGEPAQAAERFEAARALSPQSAELLVWEAKALADSGELAGAILLLDRAIALRPGLLEGWYNRACYKARAGDLEGAGQDLRHALRSPELDPLVVALDPDLAPLRADPANAEWIPMPELGLSMRVPEAPAFLGSEIEAVLRLERGADQGLSLRRVGEGSPLLRPVAWIEERSTQAPGQLGLRLRAQVMGAGEASFGPFKVSASGLEETLEAQSVRLLAPQSHTPPDQIWAGPLQAPSELLSLTTGAQRIGEWVVVSHAPGDTLQWQATEQLSLELREDGRIQAIGVVGRLPTGERVQVMRGSRLVWEGSP